MKRQNNFVYEKLGEAPLFLLQRREHTPSRRFITSHICDHHDDNFDVPRGR